MPQSGSPVSDQFVDGLKALVKQKDKGVSKEKSFAQVDKKEMP